MEVVLKKEIRKILSDIKNCRDVMFNNAQYNIKKDKITIKKVDDLNYYFCFGLEDNKIINCVVTAYKIVDDDLYFAKILQHNFNSIDYDISLDNNTIKLHFL